MPPPTMRPSLLPPQTPMEKLRREQRLTLAHVAGRAGLSLTTVHAVEKGALPKTGTTLEKIAAALGSTVAELFGGSVPPC